MKKIAVLTSGGDAPGMNAVLRTVAKVAASQGVALDGLELGFEGLVAGRFRPLTTETAEGLVPIEEADYCGGQGGTILGSARCARFRTAEGRREAMSHLAGYEGLIVVGGDGSLTGAHLLAQEHGTQVVGVPASIDNDLGCTELSLGVDTALNTIVEACDRIHDTARAHRRCFIVEVMGRESGYLAMAAAVASGAEAVLFREQGRSDEAIIDTVERAIRDGLARGKQRVLVIKSEGVKLPCTKLARELNERIEGNLVRATVLGHVVRGGRASYQDRRMAARLGYQAFAATMAGKSDVMVAWRRTPGGEETSDPGVRLFPIEMVLAESKELLDGTAPMIQWRLRMLEQVQGVMGL